MQKNLQPKSSLRQFAKLAMPKQQCLQVKGGGGDDDGDASIVIEDLIDD